MEYFLRDQEDLVSYDDSNQQHYSNIYATAIVILWPPPAPHSQSSKEHSRLSKALGASSFHQLHTLEIAQGSRSSRGYRRLPNGLGADRAHRIHTPDIAPHSQLSRGHTRLLMEPGASSIYRSHKFEIRGVQVHSEPSVTMLSPAPTNCRHERQRHLWL